MQKAGKIMSVKFREIGNDKDGKSTVTHKVGYVCYEKVEEAQKCIQLYDNSHTFGFGGRPLKVDFWQSQFDLQHENEEKNINQVKKFIRYIQHEMQ